MILIKVENYTKLFIEKCIKNNIELHNISYDNDCLFIKINNDDLDNIIKLNYQSKITIIKYYGIKNIIFNINKYLYDLIMLFFFILLIYLSSLFIIKIDIRHENKELIKKVNRILEENGIKEFTIYKTNKELNDISDNILKNNRDILDFISIKKDGITYIVNIEERIIKKDIVNKKRCNVVSTSNGVISKVITNSGVSVVEKGTLVYPNDILISGEIKLNEDIKDNVCANGLVLASTWYKGSVSYPLNIKYKYFTNNTRYNIYYNNKPLYKDHYDFYIEDIILDNKLIKIVKEKEYIYKTKRISINEAREEAIKEVINKIKIKKDRYFKIINKKVLKENINNSKIELDIFIDAEESIGKIVEY